MNNKLHLQLISFKNNVIIAISARDATYKVSKMVLRQIIISEVNSPQFCRFHAIHHCSKLIVSVNANAVTHNDLSI